MQIKYLNIFRNLEEFCQTIQAIQNTEIKDDKFHIELASKWLLEAQSINNDGGYAHSYSLFKGWGRSYPETTGYIIPTMLNLGEYLNDETFISSAFKGGEWLLSIQQKDGSFLDLSKRKQIFDTGQIIEGLIELYKRTNNNNFLNASINAGNFLLENQDGDGKWSKFSYNNIPHTYYSKVSGNLLKLYEVSKEDKYRIASYKNLEWVIMNQMENGYFSFMSFIPNQLPYLHNIIYVLEGLLESYKILRDESIFSSLMKTVNRLVEINKKRDSILYSQYNNNWDYLKKERCLVGLAQWAGLLIKLYTMIKKEDFFKLSVKTINYLKSKQVTKGSRNILGALPDTIPIWGNYRKFTFSNWTVKFYIDGLLFLKTFEKDIDVM